MYSRPILIMIPKGCCTEAIVPNVNLLKNQYLANHVIITLQKFKLIHWIIVRNVKLTLKQWFNVNLTLIEHICKFIGNMHVLCISSDMDPCSRNPCRNTEICHLISPDSHLCLKTGENKNLRGIHFKANFHIIRSTVKAAYGN